MNISDYLLANGNDTDPAIVDGGRSYSYADLRAAAGRLAAELAGASLPPGGRVGILGVNSLFWAAGYLAAMKLGYVAVPFSEKLSPEALTPHVRLADCGAVFLDRRSVRRFAPVFGEGMKVITDECLGDGAEPYWPRTPVQDLDADAVLMFTSGTTSAPKAVRVTHRNLRANTDSIISYLGLAPDDRMLVILPFFYCYGASLLHTHLRVGGSVVLCNSFVFPETAIDLLEREQCTGFAGVPSSFMLLLRLGSFASRPLPSLRHIQQAGGKLPPALIEELVAAKPAARLFVMYGQTEATARLSHLPPEQVLAKLGSIGRGIPGVELRVLDERGEEVAAGERGEIFARGANISPGYFRDPEGSAAKFTPAGLRTGDIGVVDEDGYIFIVDRVADFIKSWGNRVSSAEVEACALRLPELVAAAAVGVPDEAAGEAVTLFVTVRPEAMVTPERILDFMRRALPTYMVPQSVILLEEMPHNANGKIVKSRLRELAAERSEKVVECDDPALEPS